MCKVLSLTRVLGSRSCSEVRGVRVLKLKSIYLGGGGSQPIYTYSKLPLCNNDYKSKCSKNLPVFSIAFLWFSVAFHSLPLSSIVFRCLLPLSIIFCHIP